MPNSPPSANCVDALCRTIALSTPARNRSAVAAFPDDAAAHGVVLDALIELGRYDEAQAVADQLAVLDAGLPSLARQSYVKELLGDLPEVRAWADEARAVLARLDARPWLKELDAALAPSADAAGSTSVETPIAAPRE